MIPERMEHRYKMQISDLIEEAKNSARAMNELIAYVARKVGSVNSIQNTEDDIRTHFCDKYKLKLVDLYKERF